MKLNKRARARDWNKSDDNKLVGELTPNSYEVHIILCFCYWVLHGPNQSLDLACVQKLNLNCSWVTYTTKLSTFIITDYSARFKVNYLSKWV